MGGRMNEALILKIQEVTAKYFSPGKVLELMTGLKMYLSDEDMPLFYQVVQNENLVQFEMAIHSKNTLVDITLTASAFTTSFVPINKIANVSFSSSENASALKIVLTDQHGLEYSAVTDFSRKSLKKYYDYLFALIKTNLIVSVQN